MKFYCWYSTAPADLRCVAALYNCYFKHMLVQYMKSLVKSKKELTVEERNLLSVAYKNVVGSRRSSWRVISSILEKKSEKPKADDEVAKVYREEIKKELKETCDEVIVSSL